MKARAYYNEFDKGAAEWLRELIREKLIMDGEVDERSITDVEATDLVGFTRCHFFAGVAGWELALQLAGWPDDMPVWTGSCPCQPFSSAGKRKGAADERDLWPEFFRLIREARPSVVFGEQVASSEVVGTELEAAFIVAVQAGRFAKANKLAKRLVASGSFHFDPRWITRIRADLEREDYALRAEVLGSHSAGAPNIRQRLWWLAESAGAGPGPSGSQVEESKSGRSEFGREGDGIVGGMADANGVRFPRLVGCDARRQATAIGRSGETRRLGYASGAGLQERIGGPGIQRRASRPGPGEATELRSDVGRLAQPNGPGLGAIASDGICHNEHNTESCCESGGLDDPLQIGRRARPGEVQAGRNAVSGTSRDDFWSAYELVYCRDAKYRRVEPGTFPLASGVSGRVGMLRGYGNAINPYVAKKFIAAYFDAKEEMTQSPTTPAGS